MMRKMLLIPVVMLSASMAQEKPLPATDRTLPVGDAARSLPSFDLPQFVITGRESIDLPAAEKRSPESAEGNTQITRPVTAGPEPTQAPVAGTNVPRVRTEIPASHLARVWIGIGSYSSFDAGIQASGPVEGIHLNGAASYSSTDGFAQHTAADRLSISGGVRSNTSLLHGILEQERMGAQGAFTRSGYFWYGSPNPEDDRTVMAGSGVVDMSGDLVNGMSGLVSVSYSGGSVRDTSSSVTEGIVGVAANLEGQVFGLPTTMHAGFTAGGNSGGSGGSYSSVEGGMQMRWDPIPLLSTSLSVGLALISGDGGQKKTVFLPGFTAVFEITPEHRFRGTYSPRVQVRSMLDLVGEVPYLDASQPVRHAVIRNSGHIGVESDWADWLRSSIYLESSTWSDFPVVSDTSGVGRLRLFYGDVTQTGIRASAVAKLPPNHYFSAIAIVRSSKSSTSGLSVPYLPSAELRVSYQTTLAELLTVQGIVQLVSAREARAIGPSRTIGGYAGADVRASYAVLPGLSVWAAVRNLLDASIEYWDGYREAPFSLNIGATYSL